MASNPLRVSQLIDSASPLTWQESVALVRGIAAVRGGSAAAVPSGSFEEFAVQENGEVTVVGTAPPLSVSELALLLARLLPSSTPQPDGQAREAGRGKRPPAALYFTIARALALVDAPSFGSMQDFSAALARFERARPTVVLQHLFARHTMAGAFVADRADAVGEGGPVAPTSEWRAGRISGHDSGAPVPDRRRQRMPSDVLRRMLREEDRRNFVEMQSRAGTTRAAKKTRQTGPDAQMLRRFIREADELTYALMRDGASTAGLARAARPARRAGYHAAFVMLVLFAAVMGFLVAGWQRVPSTPQAAPAGVDRVVPAATNGSTAETAAVTAAAIDATMPPARPAEPSATKATPPSAPRSAATGATKKPTPAKGVVSTRAAIQPPAAKRRGPVPRLFAAIYHRLGGLMRRDSAGDGSSQ
jgi:hypothetical protein